MNTNELKDKIEEASGLSIDELPRVTGLSWFQGLTGKQVVVVTGAEFPLLEGAVVYAMFQNDDVVRVYTLSKDQKKASPPSRYTFTKSAPTFVAEVMSLDTFIDEIAEEWQMVAGLDLIEDADDDDDAPETTTPQFPDAHSSATPPPATLTP